MDTRGSGRCFELLSFSRRESTTVGSGIQSIYFTSTTLDAMVHLIDLSGHVEEGQPVYPGGAETVFWLVNTHERAAIAWEHVADTETGMIRKRRKALESGRAVHPQRRAMILDEHGPTHVDAFCHVDPAHVDRTIDQEPLERFFGDCIAIDVSHVSPEEYIEIDDIEQALGSLEIQDGDMLLLHTGHRQRNYSTDDEELRYRYLHEYTGLSKAAAYWLGDLGVTNIGIDSPSIDHSNAYRTKDYPAHEMCSEYDVFNMENLANIDAVAGHRFTLCAFPLKIRGGTGSPIRAVAIMD